MQAFSDSRGIPGFLVSGLCRLLQEVFNHKHVHRVCDFFTVCLPHGKIDLIESE